MDVINAFNFNTKSLNSGKFSMKKVTGFYIFFSGRNYIDGISKLTHIEKRVYQ